MLHDETYSSCLQDYFFHLIKLQVQASQNPMYSTTLYLVSGCGYDCNGMLLATTIDDLIMIGLFLIFKLTPPSQLFPVELHKDVILSMDN